MTFIDEKYTTIKVNRNSAILYVTLNRPECRNAMSELMVEELSFVMTEVASSDIRGIIIRGADGHFCAGADIKDMAQLRKQAIESQSTESYARFNRRFGALIEQVNQLPQIVVCVLEGAVLGGGLGLACVSDCSLAHVNSQFGLPETGLGVLPAQIAPFVVQRIGLSQARRLALLGVRFDGAEACRLGIVHQVYASGEDLELAIQETIQSIMRVAPLATRHTKALLHHTQTTPLDQLLDEAAQLFASAVHGAEGQEGTLAFVQKRKPYWVHQNEDDS